MNREVLMSELDNYRKFPGNKNEKLLIFLGVLRNFVDCPGLPTSFFSVSSINITRAFVEINFYFEWKRKAKQT